MQWMDRVTQSYAAGTENGHLLHNDNRLYQSPWNSRFEKGSPADSIHQNLSTPPIENKL